MGSSAGFHANQFDLQVRREVQQLLARKLLAHYNLAAQVEPNQVKDCLAKINADRVYLQGMPPPFTSHTPVAGWVKTADHPISYPQQPERK
jgi:hypothetical protein